MEATFHPLRSITDHRRTVYNTAGRAHRLKIKYLRQTDQALIRIDKEYSRLLGFSDPTVMLIEAGYPELSREVDIYMDTKTFKVYKLQPDKSISNGKLSGFEVFLLFPKNL